VRRGSIAAALTALASAVVVTVAAATTSTQASSSQLAGCTNVSLGFMGPLTGPGGVLGREQLSWLEFGVQKYNKAEGTRFAVAQGDIQLKASVAESVARKFVADRRIKAVVGASESEAVRVSGNLFEKAALASISGSATAVDLTKGRPYSTFFRVVPHDGIQAPDVAAFVSERLQARSVVVIDSQDEYSVPLAEGVSRGLKARGVDVSRESVLAGDTDFSWIVANVEDDVSVVVFATQAEAAANTISQQLRELGKKAVVFATDGAYSPSEFAPAIGYVSVFAPDLHFDPKARAIVREYRRFARKDTSGVFGPATYMAGWVAMAAITEACADGVATRAEVVKQVRATSVPSIIGDDIRFDAKGDLKDGGFVIYRITNGKYRPVR
jgi:branched-chain amino acid transport system substrate-binding protein